MRKIQMFLRALDDENMFHLENPKEFSLYDLMLIDEAVQYELLQRLEENDANKLTFEKLGGKLNMFAE